MKKLILEEDDIIEEPHLNPEIRNDMATSLITSLIKNSWDSVDMYNSVRISLEEADEDGSIVKTIDDIINSLYINIGQLENILQNVNSQAEMIDYPEESDLGEIVVPKEEVEVELD